MNNNKTKIEQPLIIWSVPIWFLAHSTLPVPFPLPSIHQLINQSTNVFVKQSMILWIIRCSFLCLAYCLFPSICPKLFLPVNVLKSTFLSSILHNMKFGYPYHSHHLYLCVSLCVLTVFHPLSLPLSLYLSLSPSLSPSLSVSVSFCLSVCPSLSLSLSLSLSVLICIAKMIHAERSLCRI